MKNVKFPKEVSSQKIREFFKTKGLSYLLLESNKTKKKVNQLIYKKTLSPELKDLYRLYQFVFLNKRITALEFGSGWSSIILSLALDDLKKKYKKNVKTLRRNNPFELFVLENEKKYLEISKKKLKKFNSKNKIKTKINFNLSKVKMTKFNGYICTEYEKLPMCNPDFIYLDGPNPFNTDGKVNNISTKHKDMMPMICDILKFEFFYTPGTIIVTDGRSANAIFLKLNFKRKWLHKHDIKHDQHIFYLDDPCLGRYNKLQLDFYKNEKKSHRKNKIN